MKSTSNAQWQAFVVEDLSDEAQAAVVGGNKGGAPNKGVKSPNYVPLYDYVTTFPPLYGLGG
jgi:hypothetical protein